MTSSVDMLLGLEKSLVTPIWVLVAPFLLWRKVSVSEEIPIKPSLEFASPRASQYLLG